MSRKRWIDAHESETEERRHDERGDTLIEVLLAIVILGIAGVALLTAFATAITASSEHRHLAALDSSVRGVSDQAIAQVQEAGNNAFGPSNCTNNQGTSYKPTWNLTGSFTVTSYTVTYWNGSSFVPAAALTNCTGYEPQLWTITIGSGSYSTTVSTVIYDPQAPPVSGGSTPYQLVFLQPVSTGTGTVNAAVSPQPIVAVEDQAGNIVYSDASSVTLTASGGSGSLSNNCSGVENEGIVSFSGCSFSATGTYSLTASDSNAALHQATGASYSITAAPPAKLVFTTATLVQGASTNAGTTKVTVQEQDAFNNPDPGALTVNLTSSSSTGFFTLTSGGAPGTGVNSVAIPAGQSSVSFYYGDTTAGSPTFSAASSGLQTAMQGETINPATASKLVFTTPPATVSAGTGFSVGVTVEDQFGNPITTGNTGSTDTIKLALSSNSFAAGTTTVNASNGLATFTGLKIDIPANYTITATDSTRPTTVTSVTSGQFTVTPAPPSQLIFTSTVTGNQPVGTTASVGPFVVKVEDQFGNAVANTGAPVSLLLTSNSTGTTFFTPTSGGATAGTATIPTGASFSVPFYYSDTKSGSPTLSVSASVNTFNVSGSTSGFTMTPGSENKLAITAQPPSSVAVHTNFSVGVTIEDQFGNTITTGNTGSTDTIALALSSGTLTGTTSKPAVGGVVTFSGLQITSLGSYTITATDTTHSLVTLAQTNTFTVTAGPPSKLVFTSTVSGNQGVGTTANVGPFAVQVQDQYGNPVNAGAAVNLTLSTTSTGTTFFTPTSGGTTAGTVTIANGASTSSNFYYSDTQAGTPTITASATVNGSNVAGTSNGFTMVAGVANQLSFTTTVTGNQTVGSAASVGPFAVQLQDQFGNPVNAGATVTLGLTTNSTGTTGHPPFFTPTHNGTAAAAVTIPNGTSTSSNFYYSDTKVGTPTINVGGATVNGQTVTGDSTNGFTMVAAAANKFVFTSTVTGNQAVSASASVGPFAVQLQDSFGNPVNAGSTVTLGLTTNSTGTTGHTPFFTTTSGGTTAKAVTIANGTSTSSNFYYSDTNDGTPTITLAGATVNGSAVSGTTTGGFTMVAGVANKFAFTSTVSGNQTVSSSASVGPFAVQLQDSFGNAVVNTGGAVTLTLSSNSAGTPFFTTTSGGTTAGAVTIANGTSTSSNFYYSDTKVGTPTITLAGATVNTQTVSGTTTGGFTMTSGAANKFVFTSTVTGNQTVSSSASVGPFAVQLQDSFGNPVNAGATVTLGLTTNSTGTTGHTPFFTTTSGGTTAGAVTIANGTSTSSNFYYSDTNDGTPTITLAGATVNTQTVSGTTTGGFTMVPGAANKLAFTSTVSGNQGVGTTASVGPFAVQVQDQFGNIVTNGATATLTLSSSSSGTTFFTTTSGGTTAGAVTIPNGTSTSSNFYYSDTKAGTPTITASATVNGNAVAGTTNGFTMTSGVAKKFVFTSTVSGNQTVSSSASVGPFAVQLQDSFGNPVNAGATVTLGLTTNSTGTTGHTPFFTTTSGGTTAGAVTIANGTSTSSNFYYSDTKVGTPTITLAGATVNTQTVSGTTTGGFTMVPGTANSLTLSAASTTPAAGAADNLTINALDSFGNPATGYTGPKNLTFGGANTIGTFAPTVTNSTGTPVNFASSTAINFTNGTATVTGSSNGVMRLYQAGTDFIAVTDGTISNGTGLSVTVSGGVANKFAFTSTVTGNQTVSSSASVGPFAVQLQDSFGNPVNAGATVTLGLTTNSTGTTGHTPFFTTTSGGTTAGAVTIANGTSTSSNFYYSDTKVGTPTITLAGATVNTQTVSGTTTGGFTMTSGAANKFVFTSTVTGNQTVSSSASVGPFAVQLQDSFGNPVNAGATVTLGLTTNSTGTTGHTPFFTTTSGGTTAGAVTIANGTSTSSNFYYSDTNDGTPTITLAGATVNTQTVSGTTTGGFTMVPGAANKLAFTSTVSGNQGVGTTASVGPFAVQVQDQFGNIVTNGATATLTLSSSSSGTTFFTTTSGGTTAGAVTIPNGTSTSSNFYYSDTKAGTPTITASATVNGNAVAGTTNGFTMTSGVAKKFVFTSTVSGNQTVSSSASVGPFAVQLQDSFGNPVNAGATVTLGLTTNSTGTTGHTPFFTTTSGGTTAGAVTIANGTSTSSNFYYSDTKVGTPTITLAGATVNTQTVSGTTTGGFTMVPGTANSLTLSAASTTPAAGAADNLTINALDSFGNPATGYTGPKNLTFGGANTIGTFAPTVTNSTGTPVNFASSTAINFTNGTATVTGSSNGVMRLYQAGTDFIAVTDGTISNGTGLSVTVSGGVANKFAFTSTVTGNQTVSSSASVGPFAVQLQDSFGNPVNAGATVTLGLTTNSTGTTGHTPFFTTTSGGTTAGAVTIANGTSTSSNFYYSDTKVGTPTITLAGATVNTQTVSGTTTGGFTMVPGAAHSLVFNPEPPTTGTGGATLASFGVSVEDSFGNILTTGNNGSTDTITLSLATKPTNGVFSSATNTFTNVAAVNGTATFGSVALNNTAGSYTFTATDTQSGDTGVTSVTSTPATVITASHIALVGTPSTATVKNATSLTINAPSAMNSGDVLVAQVTARDNLATAAATSITAPTGWTAVTNATYDGNATLFQFAYTCVVGSTGCPASSTSWTWSWPCTNGSCAGAGGTAADGSGGILEFSGVNTTTPIDVSGNSGKGSGTTATAPAVTTTQANDEIIAIFASGGAASFSGKTPTGTNAPSSPNYAVTSANTGSCAGTTGACTSVAAGVATTSVQPGAGSSGTYTLPGTSTNYAWTASTIGLKGF